MFITIQIFTLVSLLLLLLGARQVEKNNTGMEGTIGLGKGIVILVSQWIGLTTFLVSSQVSYEQGVSGLVSYCLAGLASLFCLYFLLKNRAMPHTPDHMGRGIKPFLLLYYLENFVVSLLAAKLILKLFYNVNIVILAGLLIVFYQFILLAKSKNLYIRSLIISMLSLIATVLLPTFVYLKVSVPTIYSGVHFLATEMLILDDPSRWILGGVLFIHFTAHNLLNQNMWKVFTNIKQAKRSLAFTISSFIWFFVPLSMGTLAFVAKASAVWPASNDEVGLQVVRQVDGQLGMVLLVVTLLVILFSSLASNLVDKTFARKDIFVKAGLLGMAAVIVTMLPKLTILDVMVFTSIFWAAMIPAMYLRRTDLSPSWVTAFIILTSVGAGINGMINFGLEWGILFDALISVCLSFLCRGRSSKEKGRLA
ncbi:hypothetical protein QNH20_12740 [Neobacillus sp. WH10]|uniref:hypothetical protein n=1 Tax=Neobacillus sp. WH10 TaxID=3047873 RepID=UPI0024C0FE5F|nr:hypothetical protein [Neobacillus sp. WH10]WHY79948.1 hypothetical protein QNH20_12740 [Neobacillus sp. WH10]